MNNSDERDYSEEEYNRRTCPECGNHHEKYESCICNYCDGNACNGDGSCVLQEMDETDIHDGMYHNGPW